jgi:hypothetical protein
MASIPSNVAPVVISGAPRRSRLALSDCHASAKIQRITIDEIVQTPSLATPD